MKAFMEEKSIISLFKKYANRRSLKIGHRTSQGIYILMYIYTYSIAGHIYICKTIVTCICCNYSTHI